MQAINAAALGVIGTVVTNGQGQNGGQPNGQGQSGGQGGTGGASLSSGGMGGGQQLIRDPLPWESTERGFGF